MASRQLLIAALSAAVSGNAHIVSPEDGSSPAGLIPPPPHGTHQPDCTRSSARHGLWTHSLIGPSVEVPVPSPRWTRSSHAVAPVNIPVEVVSEVVVQPVISW